MDQNAVGSHTKQSFRNKHVTWISRCLSLCGVCPLLTTKLSEERSSLPLPVLLCFRFLDCTGRNIGQVCFANNPISGYLILLGLAVGMPIVAAFTVFASTLGIIFALVIRLPSSSLAAGLCCYNAALLGAVMPALLLGPQPVVSAGSVWLSVALGSVCTVVMSSSLGNSLGSLKPAMPIFTLPFNLVGLFSYVCLRVNQPIGHLPDSSPAPQLEWYMVLQGGFLGAGQVFAVQDWWCSGLVLLGMMICSPALSLAGFLGSLIGTCFAVLVSPTLYEAAYAGIYGYNGFLAACAVAFFFVPGWRSLLLALMNSALATAMQVALSYAFADVHLPGFTLPFVGASLLLLGVTAEDERALPRPFDLTFPEQHLTQWRRRLSKAQPDSVNNSEQP